MSELSELFADFSDPLRLGIADLGWSDPTPVQERVIPRMREGTDLIVQAQTGSGKTGAFGLPIILNFDPEIAACQSLIMTPTRELANQVAGEIAALSKHTGLRCLAVYGGVGYQHQIDGIEAGAHVIVGTPGRMLDHLGAGRLKVDSLRTLILDEADELLSLGFWPDMREISKYLPKQRQSCLFSATMPERVQSLARVFLSDPSFVSLSEDQLAPQEIQHFFVVTTAQEKEANLARILEYEEPESAIIFCNTKDDVRFVTSYLQRRGFDADQISGDLSQAAREQAMGRIKAGQLRFLVATDVAARGIDISDLTHVIGYSAPQSPEVYVHRTGRTGRAGKAGVAISLVSGLDIGNFRQLQQVNKIEITEREVPSEEVIIERLQDQLSVKVEQEIREIPQRERAWKIDRFLPIVDSLANNDEGRKQLAAICASFLKEHRPDTRVDSVEAAPKDRPDERAPSRSGSKRRNDRTNRGGGGRRRRRPR